MAGAPIGTDDFCKNFVKEKVKSVKKRIQCLSGIDPQVGMYLIRKCLIPALTFLAQVTPSTLTLGAFAKYDDFLIEFIETSILKPRGSSAPACTDDRKTKFRKRVRLPLRHRGGGITAMAAIAPAAFFASVVTATVVDPVLRGHIDGFERFAAPVHRQLAERLGPEPPDAVTERLPTDFKETHTALLDTSFFVELLNKEPALKLQKMLSYAIQAQAAKQLLVSYSPNEKEDFVAAHTNKAPMSLLSLPLAIRSNRISPPHGFALSSGYPN